MAAGLGNLTETQWSGVISMPVKNVGKHKTRMLPATRALLEEFYRPFNEKLAKQMGDTRYLWAPNAEEGTQA